MSLTSGFYNSIDGDRKYSSEQMSAIFDGVITDGIFANIGDCFKVAASENNKVSVGTGKAWFNGKWILNDSSYDLNMDYADNISNRIDAVVIEVNLNTSGRETIIKVIKGSPSNTPEKPELISTDGIYQYAIAYVMRKNGALNITDDDIINIVGTEERPYATTLLDPNKAMYMYESTAEDTTYEVIKSGTVLLSIGKDEPIPDIGTAYFDGKAIVNFDEIFTDTPIVTVSLAVNPLVVGQGAVSINCDKFKNISLTAVASRETLTIYGTAQKTKTSDYQELPINWIAVGKVKS